MSGELNQDELTEVRRQCREIGNVPVSNLPNENLRLAELNRLRIIEKDFNQDHRYSSLTKIAAYLTECPNYAINILSSTILKC